MKKLVGLVGTNSNQSTNRHLLQFMTKHYADLAEIELVEINHLPLFNKPTNYTVMPEVQILVDKIEAADGVVIATPEYDHAPTAALNNALAWLSYKVYPFVDKPVMIVGASYGTLGSSRAQIQLQQLLEAPELKAHVMPSSEYLLGHSLKAFDDKGTLVYEDKVVELDQIFESFLQFIDMIKQLPKSPIIDAETQSKYIWDTKQKRGQSKMKLVGLVGANGEKSFNRLLLKFIEKEFKDLFELEVLEIKDVPLFNQSNEQTDSEPIQYLSQKIREADGIIIATPEHNRTVPPALKSVIEWLSNKTHPFEGQPVLIVGASYYDQGTSRAQSHLRQILEAPGVGAFTFPGNEFLLGHATTVFDGNENIKGQNTVDFLRNVLEKFVRYVKVMKRMDDHKRKPDVPSGRMKADADIEQTIKNMMAVDENTSVELNRGILTVDQVDYLLKAMPFEVSYLDKNNQILYQENPVRTSGPNQEEKTIANALQHLRLGHMNTFRIKVPTKDPDTFLMHNYQAIRDDEGKFIGINKQVRDLQPMIDWFLEETGQELVEEHSENISEPSVYEVSETADPETRDFLIPTDFTEATVVDGVSSATEKH